MDRGSPFLSTFQNVRFVLEDKFTDLWRDLPSIISASGCNSHSWELLVGFFMWWQGFNNLGHLIAFPGINISRELDHKLGLMLAHKAEA